jgi:hypothetical protein
MINTQTLWKAANDLLKEGISTIPTGKEKKPLVRWTKYQKELMPENEFGKYIDSMEGIAVICGEVSGNMEVVDVDSKYNKGFEQIILHDLRTLLPDIFKRLRVVQTPSGGLHLIYRIEGKAEKNQKLAKIDKQTCFIETRGEGGYIIAYPSEGYKLIQDVEIPTFTELERNTLIGHCRSYNQHFEPVKTKLDRNNEIVYDENPFQSFNLSCDPIDLATQCGFSFFKENNRYLYFTRPGKKSGVSLSFNKETRCYWLFSSSTELENDKGYFPASLHAKLINNGDWKQTYRDLVGMGYGKYKPNKEEEIIYQAARSRSQLPANISQEGKVKYDEILASIDKACPFGIFWFMNDKGNYEIDRQKMLDVCDEFGFKNHNGNVVQIKKGVIYELKEKEFENIIKNYIFDDDLYPVLNCYMKFMEQHRKYMIESLQTLDGDLICKDDKKTSYKHYLNTTLMITDEEIYSLDEAPGLIFEKDIQKRNFKISEDYGIYLKFLENALGTIDEYTMKFIGWLAHNYKDETIGYIGVLSEITPDPSDGGGSGKNLFCNLLKGTTTVLVKPASQITFDERALNSWNGERIFVASDPQKDFNFEFFKELSTGSAEVKKLYKDPFTVASEDMFKLVVPTNLSAEIKDGGLKRRLRFLEFTDFYTKAGGVDTYHGCYFPNDWTEDDWNGFDSFIALCLQKWLSSGCKLEVKELSTSGWDKQFEHSFGNFLHSFCQNKIADCIHRGEINNADFKDMIIGFANDEGVKEKYIPSMHKINKALEAWCKHHEIQFEKDAIFGIFRGKRFVKK